MTKTIWILLLLLSFLPASLWAQTRLKAKVIDNKTKEVVPFATIKLGNSGLGLVAELNGTFEVIVSADITYIEVTSLGYKPLRIELPLTMQVIPLEPQGNSLSEVVVTPPYDKMRRILNKAIANKARNNPDNYDWYRCNVYYKMTGDLVLPDSVMQDTSARSRERQNFVNTSHMFLSETYSKRTWKYPQKLQEDVSASRISGLKKAMFTGMVTDILPFHAYTDYLTLNGKDYHNPVSRGYEQYYKFNLADEVVQDGDTVWVLSFAPKGRNANELKGTVYINSDGFAISQLIARANDSLLKLNVRIEQQYEQVAYSETEKRWFPKHLNYVIEWLQLGTTKSNVIMKGNSRIDSVSWTEDKSFKFDKGHTVRLADKADHLADSTWQKVRPEALDKKETRTYEFIDSLGAVAHLDQVMNVMSRLPEGKISLGIFDVDVMRLFSYNYYENVRLGAGLQTNERFIKWMSVGGWGGYGFGDTHWKYGAFAEFYLDKHREFVVHAGYTDDISDPGRIHIDKDLDKSYLRSYLLRRVDRTEACNIYLRKKIGYWNWKLEGQQQVITPQYNYGLRYQTDNLTTFNATEVSLSTRYAYAERTAPFFGSYYSLGSRYPIWYAKATAGELTSGSMRTQYVQALAAVAWTKHINRIGNERIQVMGGKSWSDGRLPLSKLFAGSGFRYDTKETEPALYTFGGMMTMYPYQYYTDQFVNIIYRHDFDWKLYRLESKKSAFSSVPVVCLQYNMLYGTLDHPEVHQEVSFSVPEEPYHEGGILLQNLLRMRASNLYYLTVNAGYFYHITSKGFEDTQKDGRFAIGVGVEF